MNAHDFSEFDDTKIQQFEQDWLKGEPKALDSYLPSPSDSRFVGTLEELVHIDLEFRWKEFKANPGDQNTPPTIERYLDKHPELESVKLGLVQGEFELASRYGAKPSVQSYLDRFGDNVGGSNLRSVLKTLQTEIKRFTVVKPGTTLGHYEIMNEHGRGGFGAVWRATDTKLGRRIAVKQLGQRLAKDGESRRRFISEARVTAKLEHPGIVPVYDISNVDDDHAYYTMRLILGQTMAQAIDELHGLDPKSPEFELLRQRLLTSFIDACQTIQYAHSQGVIHRDIKPQNMIVGNYGETIILDWGLASVIEVNLDPTESILLNSDPEILSKEESLDTLRGNVMGTPAYMPAEQARGDFDAITRRSDIYSLGTTLYHLITGIVPFTDGPIEDLLDRVKKCDIKPAHEANPHVEKPLSAIAARAMQLDPRDRYENVLALLTDVQKFLADQPVIAFQDPPLARASRWIRKNPTTAAAIAMTVLFAMITTVAAMMVNNAWQAREEKRITDLQIAAERADATALSQIQSGRFESAANMLGQATELIAGEQRLESFEIKLASRRDRIKKIVDFYRFAMQAQEETFFDRVSRSSTYCQAALNQIGVLTNPDWWSHLPDQDLTALQKDQLRTEVYRIIGLLASMRLAETSKSVVEFDMLINPKKVDPNDPTSKLFQASGFAAGQGNRFRNSRAMRIMEDVGEFAKGNRNAIDLTNINPQNSIDAAIMGSILDNNTPFEGPGRTAVSAVLNFQNPNVVARQWLDDAVKDNPDWYWLPVFMGMNLNKTGQPEEAVKILSHAIGIRPNYWVGYQFRAWASAVAAQRDGLPRKQKIAFLNSANRDIQRAMDLEKDNSSLYWIQAIVQSQSGATQGQISQTFLKALSLHPKLGDLDEGHFSAISQMFYSRVQAFVIQQTAAGPLPSELYFLEAAGLLWQGKHDRALQACNSGLEKHPDDENLQSLRQLVQLDRSPKGATQPVTFDPADRFAWQYAMANADLFQSQDQSAKEMEQLKIASRVGGPSWQQSSTMLKMARNLIETGRQNEAIPLIHQAIELDQVLKLTEVATAAKQHSATEVTAICDAYTNSTQPKTDFAVSEANAITNPALMNGGFELGLSYYWAPYSQRSQSTTWNNSGKSRTLVESDISQAHSGNRCLSIRIDSPIESESYGLMTQIVPVTKGQTYEVSFWARAVDLADNALTVGMIKKGKPTSDATTLESGTYGWKQFKFSVVSDEATLPVSIWAQGSGKVLIDDMQIRLLAN